MQTVLVAGGAGFIGSHLCKRLLDENYFVICVDNLVTGSRENIKDLEQNPHITFIEHDITQEFSAIKYQISNISYVFHLASPASPNLHSKNSYMSLPIETLLANSLGTFNLLNLAKENSARFLFASTSEVYGDPEISPQKEDYFGNVNPNGIRSVYDEGKRFGEAMTMAYYRKYSLDVRIARIFNTYGPQMSPMAGRAVSKSMVASLKKQPIVIYGDGSQTRSFCYVSDLVEGLYQLMLRKNLSGEVINLGNPIEKTVKEFAEIVIKKMQVTAQLTYEALPPDDPMQRKPDITKAKKLLDWEPQVSLDEGLEKTIAYFKSNKE